MVRPAFNRISLETDREDGSPIAARRSTISHVPSQVRAYSQTFQKLLVIKIESIQESEVVVDGARDTLS